MSARASVPLCLILAGWTRLLGAPSDATPLSTESVWSPPAVLGLVLIAAFAVLMLVDAILMIRDPQRWMRLPGYVGFQGSFRAVDVSTSEGRSKIRAFSLFYLGLSTFLVLVAGTIWNNAAGR